MLIDIFVNKLHVQSLFLMKHWTSVMLQFCFGRVALCIHHISPEVHTARFMWTRFCGVSFCPLGVASSRSFNSPAKCMCDISVMSTVYDVYPVCVLETLRTTP